MKDKNPKKKKKSRQKQESGPSVESLGSALNALEGILEDQHVVPGSSIPTKANTGSSSDEQETIPLLEDIVIPGQKLTDATETTTGAGDPYETEAGAVLPEHSHSSASMHPRHTVLPVHNDLTLRLVNELEIIIEDSVAETLSQAKQELITKVKNHLDIVLPEILAELERRREGE